MQQNGGTIDFMLDLLTVSSSAEMVISFAPWLKNQMQADGVLFFLLNAEKTSLDLAYVSAKGLVEQASSISVHDTENPICYSLFFAGDYLVKPGSSFPNNSSYSQLFSDAALKMSALCLPISNAGKPYGVFVLLATPEFMRGMSRSDASRWVLLFSKAQALLSDKEQEQKKALELKSEILRLNAESYKRYAKKYIDLKWIDVSKTANRLKRDILRASESTLNILLIGDEGSGKKHLVSLIHEVSSRSVGPMVCVDCAKFNTVSQLEVEIFGCKTLRKNRTADEKKLGAFRRAEKGVLLLENIDTISLSMQRKLHKILLDKKIKAIGDSKIFPLDCRVICTQKNKPIFSQLSRKSISFYEAIGQSTLVLPDLNKNKMNILPLANCFLRQYEVLHKKELKGFSQPAQRFLLKNIYAIGIKTLRQMVFDGANKTPYGGVIEKKVLQQEVIVGVENENEISKETEGLKKMLGLYEVELIQSALNEAQGNLSLAAKRLSLPRRTLTYKCTKLGIERTL